MSKRVRLLRMSSDACGIEVYSKVDSGTYLSTYEELFSVMRSACSACTGNTFAHHAGCLVLICQLWSVNFGARTSLVDSERARPRQRHTSVMVAQAAAISAT